MENKKMVIIDLLNKISKNEIVPKQIKYQNTIYTFDTTDNTYYDENDKTFFQTYNYKILNDTVEILPEKNDKQYTKMHFPDTLEEFIKSYSFTDDKEIYTNGSELIPTFRLKQWEEHKEDEKNQLISFLKKHIKEIDNKIKIKQLIQQGNPDLLQEIHELRIIDLTYQEVLDFVSKGDKDDTKF